MESAHWARVKEIFADTLDQAPDTREEFAREICGTNEALLRDVLRLLQSHSRASGTLSQPLFPLALAELPDQPPRFSPSMIVAQRFRIIRLIARGGMGDIYEAEDLELRVRVALKTIRPDIAADERVLELFKNEIQTARRVTHPNVCRIYDLAQHSESTAGGYEVTVFLTMELLAGETLSAHLKTHGAFSREEALPLIRQLASALHAAHEAGVIHRDFKPGNVMLARRTGGDLHATVTDFGLAVARAQSQSQLQPLPSAAGGTPAYMAPEQAQGGEVTPAADVYALGLVIAEMSGARVNPATVSRLQTIFHAAPASSRVTLSLPHAFRRWQPVLLRCLEPDPAKRYAHPIAVAEALATKSARRPLLTRPKTLAMSTALLVTVLGLSALVAQRYGEWNITTPTTYRKLGPEDDAVGLWRPSPDGRYFAVTDWHTGNLGLRDISTGEIRLLTNKSKSPAEGQVLSAAFSPEGSRIAYTWFQNGVPELRVIDTRTGEDTLLHADPALKLCDVDDWSADGSRILARFTWEDSSQIAVISVADRSVLHPQPKGRYGSMVFAPDGAHVVFSAPSSPQDIESDIFEVPIHGGPVATLVKDPANDEIIGFSRDGRRLIFSSDRKGTYGVWAVAFSGDVIQGEPAELAHDLGRAFPLGLSQNGKLYYTVATDSEDVYTAEIDVTTARLLSAPINLVKRFRGSFRFPTWSSNGDRLSLISFLEGRPQIWIYSRETHEIHTIQPRLATFARPQWDPSGDRIFVPGSDRSGRGGIFRVDIKSGEAEMTIDRATLDGNEGVWAHDGRTLFDRFSDPKAGLFRLDVQTGRRQVLYAPPPGLDLGLENLALSPDESTLAFQARQQSSGTSSLMLIPAGGGVAHQLLTITNPERFLFGSFTWTADSSQILVVRTRDKISELWLVPVEGGSPRKIEFPSMRIVQLRMNPDGRTIAFASGEAAGEVWVAENLLP
jgi:serine/threonine protein kinase